jgi:hypothetical protein
MGSETEILSELHKPTNEISFSLMTFSQSISLIFQVDAIAPVEGVPTPLYLLTRGSNFPAG